MSTHIPKFEPVSTQLGGLQFGISSPGSRTHLWSCSVEPPTVIVWKSYPGLPYPIRAGVVSQLALFWLFADATNVIPFMTTFRTLFSKAGKHGVVGDPGSGVVWHCWFCTTGT